VILDEFQNCNFGELDTVISRIGKNSRVIICGDIMQTDLNKSKWDVTGLPAFVKIVEDMEEFDIVDFGVEDIVRSGIVKSYILAKTKYFEENEDRSSVEH
jgi:phosphate starvation-inducible PhoH-like protein